MDHAKKCIRGPSISRTEELLQLSRNQVRTIIGLLTGHSPLRGHLHKMGLYQGELTCRQCSKETETARHIITEYEALDRKRQGIFGKPRVTLEECSTQPLKNLYKLIEVTRLMEWV